MKTNDPAAKLRMVERSLTLAILEALKMWSDSQHYSRFLRQPEPGPLDKNWFEWFAVEWRVARTIKKGKLESVRHYLDDTLRQQLAGGGGAKAVDKAAQFIKDKCWSANVRKDGKASLPLSLVSKVGFLLRPSSLVPYDRYARRGLVIVSHSHKLRGDSSSATVSYCDYLSAFDTQYALISRQIRNALTTPWVTALAKRLGCPVEPMHRLRMERKIFDFYLMEIGRTPGKPTPGP